MTILNSVLKNRFGKYYKVQLPHEINTQLNLKSEVFWNEVSTRQFVNDLTAPEGYWREIVAKTDTHSSSLTTQEIESKVSELMLGGKIKLFPVDIPDIVEHPPEKRVIKKQDANYRFTSKSSLLISKPTEIKTFNDEKEAKVFLQKIQATDKQLLTIAAELNIDLPATASKENTSVISALSKAMAVSDIVIIVDKIASSPPTTAAFLEENNTVGNKKADLGPHETEEPLTNWFAMKLVNEIDEPYKNETYTISLSDKSETVNNGNINYRKEKLPAGECSVKLSEFYKNIEKWFAERGD